MTSSYLNLNKFFPPALLHPSSDEPLSRSELSRVLSPRLADLELSDELLIPIPEGVSKALRRYRPTPLFRARALEAKIGTTCRLYFKDEGYAPSGNHKINSALLVAALCRQDGVQTVTTETTGNWGVALAIAGTQYGLRVLCFIDSESNARRPDRKPAMEAAGAEVRVVNTDASHHDLLSLTADAAIKATLSLRNARYIFGSIYNYFIVPQSLIGLESRAQMLEVGEYPDIVIGCCGGGANLLGVAGAFLVDRLSEEREVRFVAAQSECCPIVTYGQRGLYSVDTLGYYPRIDTLGLPSGLVSSEYVGGLGSTVVAPPVRAMFEDGLLEGRLYDSRQASRAAKLFYEAESRWVALESAYTLAATLDLARECAGVRLLANISTSDSDRTLFGAWDAQGLSI